MGVETENVLELALRESEDGKAVVLLANEAKALFGNGGEVPHGTHRYANPEVSYLLQHLEEHDGLVIRASNERDQIDDAFRRRFDAVLKLR